MARSAGVTAHLAKPKFAIPEDLSDNGKTKDKTCTLSRMMTYAFAMNRICIGEIGMGPLDLLFMCFSLVSREVASEEDRGGWRML